MNTVIKSAVFLLVIFLAAQSLAQSESYEKVEIIPRCVDTSVNGIYLSSPQSSKKNLGDEIIILNTNADFPYMQYYNKDKTEMLTLIFHPGDIKDSFNEFKVEISSLRGEIDTHLFKEVDHFITGKGIKLGMARRELINILGKEFTSETKDNLLIINYHLSNLEDSEFLKAYNMPVYYGEYKFKSGRLVEFAFGFQYP